MTNKAPTHHAADDATPTNATLLGLGEAGAIYARGLRDAGYTVRGYDPFTTLNEAGIDQRAELAEAVGDADIVLSLVGANAAAAVARAAFPLMRAGAVFADLNTASPTLKAELASDGEAHGALFADVAVLAPVPRSGVRTPLMTSGPGADRARDLLAASGAPVDAIPGDAGDAAARKLLRSVFMKGLATTVIESLEGARAAGCEDWLRGQIISELSGDAGAFVERLESGSRQHAGRRAHEVADAGDYLASLGKPRWVADAAGQWFAELLSAKDAEGSPAP